MYLATRGNRTQVGNSLQPLHHVLLVIRWISTLCVTIFVVLEKPWRHFTTLKLCKCSQIPNPSHRIAPTANLTKTNCRWLNLLYILIYKIPFAEGLRSSFFYFNLALQYMYIYKWFSDKEKQLFWNLKFLAILSTIFSQLTLTLNCYSAL